MKFTKEKLSKFIRRFIGYGIITVLISPAIIFVLTFISPNFRNFMLDLKSSNKVVNNHTLSSSYANEGEIIAATKYAVKQRLKSPSSAKFCPKNQFTIAKTSDGITVQGYVDSQNGFGTMIRNNFKVKLSKDAKTTKSIDFN